MKKNAARATIKRQSVGDLARNINMSTVREAYTHGMGMSAYLEQLVDVDKADRQAGLDAFGLILAERGVITRSVPNAGLWADVYEDVFTDDESDRVLGLEWCTRQWKRAQTSNPATGRREIYESTDFPVNSWFRPFEDATAPRWTQIAAAIPIDQVVALTTPITGKDYRAVYLQNVDPNLKRLVRVGEAAEPPRMKLTASTHTIELTKYGRILTSSYETLRRQRLDRVAMEIALMSIQSEVDKLATIIDVIVNGDGNSGTSATNYNLTTMDPTASTSSPTPPYNVSVRGWLNFKAQFLNPYQLTTVLTQTNTGVALQMLNMGNNNVMLVQVQAAAGFGGFTAINPSLRDNVALGWTPDALPNKVIGIDARRAIERVIEIGGNIQEIERHATNQTQDIVLTEVEGYDVLDPNATAILTLTA